MSSPTSHQIAAAPESQPVLLDEILEEIFLRLDVVEDLVRVSAACTTFCRIISARRFLCRFRCLHPPPVLGVLDFDAPGAFHPAEPPHRFAAAARALAQAADFTFSFLDTPHLWKVCDARDGRVLYRRISVTTTFADLVVCDPLYRRHVQLPPVPDNLATAIGASNILEFEHFLDPATDKEKEELDLSFRVICAVHRQHELAILRFSSITGKWCGINFNRTKRFHPVVLEYPSLLQRHCAYGSFYWKFSGWRSLFMFNAREMIFSDIDHLSSNRSAFQPDGAMVEAGGGRLGLVNINFGDTDGVFELCFKTLPNSDDATEVWQHDKTLPNIGCFWSVVGAAEGYLLLETTPWWYRDTQVSHYFILDLKTLLILRLCKVTDQDNKGAQMYARFPPPWSLPSI